MSLLDVAIRRAGVGVETWLAALAALATGAAVFLMPVGVLQEAVRASGMADLLPALQPPLGWKARMGLALLSAGSAFGTALLLMRIAGRVATAAPRREEAEDAPPVPRVRRRDRHPDAPVRAPLSVSRDLGVRPDLDEDEEPVAQEPHEQEEERAPTFRRAVEDEPEEPRPARIKRRAPAEPAARSPLPWLDEPDGEAPALPRLSRLERAAKQAARPADAEPAPPEPSQRSVLPEEVEEAPPAPDPVAPEIAIEPEPAPVPQPVIVAAAAPESETTKPQPAARKSAPEPAPADQSIAALMARFEQAMERRAARPRAPEPDARTGAEDDGTDLRLRSALENLKRFAPRQG